MTETTDILALLDRHGIRYKKRGNKAELLKCVFCGGGDNGDGKTMVVYLDAGNFKCMRGSCGQTGTLWALSERLGEDPKQFYNGNGHKRMEFREEKQIKTNFKKQKFESRPITSEARKYLEKRCLFDEALSRCKVSCDEKGNICFEYYSGGELCFVKVRKPSKPQQKEPKAWAAWEGGLRTLWGLEQADESLGFLVITFGEYDRMALVQSGIANTVSVPSGDEDTAWISICWDALAKFKQIVLWCDNDASGQKALVKIADRLGKSKILTVNTPFKDANEMLFTLTAQVGRDEAEAQVYKAVESADWYHHSDLVDVSEIEYEELIFSGVESGLKEMDEITGGFLDGRLTVWLGDNAAGKSTAISQAINSIIYQNRAVCAWSGEDLAKDFKYRANVNYAGYLGCETRTSSRGTPYPFIKDEWRIRYNDFVRGKFYLYDKYQVNENDIFETFLVAYERYGCTQFVLDNLMKAVNGKESDQIWQRQARICDMFAKFCQQHKVHGHLVAHINKTGEVSEPPTKNSASGAKEITNIADTVIGWWRIPKIAKEKFNNFDALGCVLKNRVFGTEANVPLLYDVSVKRYGTNSGEMADYYGQGAMYAQAL